MIVDYDHSRNLHTLDGAAAALSALFRRRPRSVLDVGCGTGTWLRAAAALGVADLFGVDGIIVEPNELQVARELVGEVDLSRPFSLGRGFDVVLCLEVAEHLPEASAEALISSIVAHADEILFSAAIPGQPGQHHVNCQWPTYWQSRFNAHGFSCDDAPRWEIWDDDRVEPWYRQNLFRATRNPSLAGREPRIKAVVHPRFIAAFSNAAVRDRMQQVEGGSEPGAWYLAIAARKAFAKVLRGKSAAARRD
jgi:SAM-dependent methyltransferase